MAETVDPLITVAEKQHNQEPCRFPTHSPRLRMFLRRAVRKKQLRWEKVETSRGNKLGYQFKVTRVLEFHRMKSRDHLIRLKRFQVEERRRRVQQIEAMIAEFNRMATDLDREIGVEETRSGHSDPNHFAYPTYARAAGVRRDNLRRSADELKGQLNDARELFDGAIEDLRKIEGLDLREKAEPSDFGLGLAQA